MNPNHQKSSERLQGPRTGLGYRLAEAEREEQQALETAFGLLKSVRQTGFDLRSWAKRKTADVENNIRWIRHRNGLDDSEIPTTAGLSVTRSAVEGEVVAVLGRYLRTMSELRNRMHLLNPPLSARQIKPFLEALDFDHRVSVVSLQPLQIRLQEWRTLTPAVSENSLPN